MGLEGGGSGMDIFLCSAHLIKNNINFFYVYCNKEGGKLMTILLYCCYYK